MEAPDQPHTEREAALMMEIAAEKRENAKLRDRWRATISHLQGPHSFHAKEPGIYIALLRVFPNGDFVREFKRVEPDQEIYPCKEWREWHTERDRLHGKF